MSARVHRTAKEAIVTHLREAILRGELRPGDRLRQNETAERFGVSTTPVREAFRELGAQGLLTNVAHREVAVHTPSREELAEVYQLRQLIEPIEIRAAARNISADELAEARDLVERMSTEQDAGAFTVLNHRFHELLSRAARLERTSVILQGLRDTAALYIAGGLREDPTGRARAAAEHHDLIEAIAAGDEDRACDVLLDHLRAGAGIGQGAIDT